MVSCGAGAVGAVNGPAPISGPHHWIQQLPGLGFTLRNRPLLPPVATSFRYFSKQEQLSQSLHSLAILFLPAWNRILQASSGKSWADRSKGNLGLWGTGLPCPEHIPGPASSSHHPHESRLARTKKGVPLLNLTNLPEASRNKGHLIIEFFLGYL